MSRLWSVPVNFIRELAQALADGLDDVTFASVDTQPTVQRKNWSTVDLESMAAPVIFVTPGEVVVQRIGRGLSQSDYTTNVFVGRHVSTEADADDMLDLADEVLTYIKAHDWGEETPFPEGITSPQMVGITINPDDALTERNAWRAVIEVTYRVISSDALPGA